MPNDENFDPTDNTDMVIRELRAQIVRMEAELDQLAAEMREQATESEQTRARLTELERVAAELKRRIERSDRIMAIVVPATWIVALASIGFSVVSLLM